MSYHATSNRQPPQGKLALLMDFENLIIGLENSESAPEKPFSISALIHYLENQHGGVLYRKAFADWSNAKFRKYAVELSRAGVELQHVVRSGFNSKNAADTYLVIQAMDCLLHYPAIDTFVIGTGDSDFLPLIIKLKASGRRVIGIGAQGTTAAALVENCDEFLSFSAKGAIVPKPRALADFAPVRQVLQTLLANEGAQPVRRVYGVLKEQVPNFLPRNYGFNNIFDMLRQVAGIALTTREDGEEVVRLADGGAAAAPVPAAAEPAAPAAADAAPEASSAMPAPADAAPGADAPPADGEISAFADYMTQTRWFIRDPQVRLAILGGIYAGLSQQSGSVTLEQLRQQVEQAQAITDKEWFGTLFSLIHGGCLWEDPATSEKPLALRAVSLFRGVHDLDEFIIRYYCSLFHKAYNERPDMAARVCSLLMYGDTEPDHLALFELVMKRLAGRQPQV